MSSILQKGCCCSGCANNTGCTAESIARQQSCTGLYYVPETISATASASGSGTKYFGYNDEGWTATISWNVSVTVNRPSNPSGGPVRYQWAGFKRTVSNVSQFFAAQESDYLASRTLQDEFDDVGPDVTLSGSISYSLTGSESHTISLAEVERTITASVSTGSPSQILVSVSATAIDTDDDHTDGDNYRMIWGFQAQCQLSASLGSVGTTLCAGSPVTLVLAVESFGTNVTYRGSEDFVYDSGSTDSDSGSSGTITVTPTNTARPPADMNCLGCPRVLEIQGAFLADVDYFADYNFRSDDGLGYDTSLFSGRIALASIGPCSTGGCAYSGPGTVTIRNPSTGSAQTVAASFRLDAQAGFADTDDSFADLSTLTIGVPTISTTRPAAVLQVRFSTKCPSGNAKVFNHYRTKDRADPESDSPHESYLIEQTLDVNAKPATDSDGPYLALCKCGPACLTGASVYALTLDDGSGSQTFTISKVSSNPCQYVGAYTVGEEARSVNIVFVPETATVAAHFLLTPHRDVANVDLTTQTLDCGPEWVKGHYSGGAVAA